MSLSWTCPWWLLIAGVVGLGMVMLLRGLRPHSRRWKWVCIVLPMGAMAVLAAGLAGPEVRHWPASREVVVLLDLSPSTRVSVWRNPAWVRGFVAEHLAPATRVTVVGFAAEPQVILRGVSLNNAAGWPTTWPAVRGEASDVGAALAWRESPEDTRPRWLISDGFVDEASLRRAGAFELAVTVEPPAAADVGVTDLQVDLPAADVMRGPEVRARITATGVIAGKVLFVRAGKTIAEQRFSFAGAGTRVLVATDPLPLGGESPKYEVRVAPDRADPWPEDDVAAMLTPPRGPPRTLIVGSDLTVARALAGERTTVVAPEGVPSGIGDLLEYQLVVLADMPAAALRPGTAELLDRFVRQTGGGVMLVGSTRAFVAGGYLGTPLEGLSPLASTPPDRKPMQVVFVLDASGSMKEEVAGGRPKFKYVIDGVGRAMESLRDGDRVVAVTFGRSVRQLAAGSRAEVGEKLLKAMQEIVPDGPTSPDSTLGVFEGDLDERSLVVLLTDGEIPAEGLDVSRWAKLLGTSKAKLTLVAPKAAGGTLEKLASQTNATWLATDDAAEWPKLLRQAVEEPIVGKASTLQLPWRGVDVGPLSGTTSAWIRTWAKPEATLKAAGGRAADIPLAATARRGLGQVAAVAMSEDGGDLGGLLRTLAQDITPPAGDRRWVVASRRGGGRWVLRARGSDEKGFYGGEKLSAEVLGEGGVSEKVPFEAVGPGEYEAALPAGVNVFRAIVTRQDPAGPVLVARVNPPALASNEWPACAAIAEPPREAVRIGVTDATPTFWRPLDLGVRRGLAGAMYALAATMVLAALYLRRGGR